jgi:hypothetical protein
MDRELKRVILVGLGLVVLLFGGRMIIGSIWDESSVTRQLAAFRNRLRSGGEADSRPERREIQRMAALRDELTGKLELSVARIGYTLPEAFTVRSGESPDLRYIEIVRREQDELVKGAAFVGKSVPSNLGLPELNPTGLEDVLRALRSLHMVHGVVSVALDADVDAVDDIRLPTLNRRARAEGGFLRNHDVEFELHGSSRSVRDTLAGIVALDPYLALSDVRLEAEDPDGERIRCRFTARAVIVDPEQAVLNP